MDQFSPRDFRVSGVAHSAGIGRRLAAAPFESGRKVEELGSRSLDVLGDRIPQLLRNLKELRRVLCRSDQLTTQQLNPVFEATKGHPPDSCGRPIIAIGSIV